MPSRRRPTSPAAPRVTWRKRQGTSPSWSIGASRTLLGAFIAGPAASEVIHEAVLAIKTHTSLDVLADTIHAFPTTARVMGGLFAQARDRLDAAS